MKRCEKEVTQRTPYTSFIHINLKSRQNTFQYCEVDPLPPTGGSLFVPDSMQAVTVPGGMVRDFCSWGTGRLQLQPGVPPGMHTLEL